MGREDSKIKKVASIKTLAGILSARSLRVEVVEFVGINSLRMELYGCHIHARKGLSKLLNISYLSLYVLR